MLLLPPAWSYWEIFWHWRQGQHHKSLIWLKKTFSYSAYLEFYLLLFIIYMILVKASFSWYLCSWEVYRFVSTGFFSALSKCTSSSHKRDQSSLIKLVFPDWLCTCFEMRTSASQAVKTLNLLEGSSELIKMVKETPEPISLFCTQFSLAGSSGASE